MILVQSIMFNSLSFYRNSRRSKNLLIQESPRQLYQHLSRDFLLKHHNARVLSRRSMLYIVKKFNRFGTVHNLNRKQINNPSQSNSGRLKTVRVQYNIGHVRNLTQTDKNKESDDPTVGSCRANAAGVSKSSYSRYEFEWKKLQS